MPPAPSECRQALFISALTQISVQMAFSAGTAADPREDFEEFLGEGISAVNQSQRVILLAEDFDFEVLITAEWLTEKYDLDIRCYRLALSTEAERDFLTCTCIYPPPEITEHAIRRKHGILPPPPWSDWEAALAGY